MAVDLARYGYSVVEATRTVNLAVLHDPQIGRLGVGAAELCGCPPGDYPWTAEWAQAIHDDATEADGIIWVPRHHNTANAIMLFGDRVHGRDLKVVRGPQPLASGIGFRQVLSLLEAAGVAVIAG